MLQAERCIRIGACHCGAVTRAAGIRVIAINAAPGTPLPYCANAGFETLVTVPALLDGQVVGELDLFFHAAVELSAAERSLLDALLQHLVMASENLRLKARETEAAVAEERTLLARELHDSIAQSLAFLDIQVELMRAAMARGDAAEMTELLEQIDTGVRESYADVRELLLHFRTRTTEEDISIALATTLRKFELQSGVATTLNVHGQGLPLPPVQQLQVLHVIQEALSNVRKHARATRARVDVYHDPPWRFEVHDDGAGFSDAQVPDETHVGLLIMRERAERIGARVEVTTNPAGGTCVRLELPAA
jgi:two-component system nitrate/nitrite sensor histidine kinase NarX